jgi:hypothetical protein
VTPERDLGFTVAEFLTAIDHYRINAPILKNIQCFGKVSTPRSG